jgi:hypothetical protein
LRRHWTLCELENDDLEPVDARLLSTSTQSFEIEANEPTFVYYTFEVDGEYVPFGGQLVLGIDVNETPSGTGGFGGTGGFAGAAGFGGGTGGNLHEACEAAPSLDVGTGMVVSGSTAHSPSNAFGMCAGWGPENIYSFELEEQSRVDFQMNGYDTVLYIRRECESAESELVCNDDWDSVNAHVTATLDPGRYYLFADSYGSGGDYELLYGMTSSPCGSDPCPEAQICIPSTDWTSYTCECPAGQLPFEDGCVDNPCDPNPCTTVEHQTVCMADLPGDYVCECSPGYMDDGQDGCVEDPNANDWTFMVFLNADNNLSFAGYNDVDEMAQVGSTDDVDIVALFDTYDEEANIIHIGQGDYDVVESWGEADMASPDTLAEFGVWAATHYPARHFALVMWDHGDGWKTKKEKCANRSVTRGFSVDDHGGTGVIDISNGEYASALATITSTIGTKLDVVGFDVCFMGMWEVAEASAPYANYLVASSETEPADGWAYDTALTLLADNPAATPVELGIQIVDTYYQASEADSTMAVTDLSHLSVAEEALTAFADKLMANPELFRQIDRIREQTQTFRIYEHRDLYDFALRVSLMPEAPEELQLAALNLMAALHGVIAHSQAQDEYPGSQGLAIYFPPWGSYVDPSYTDVGAVWSANTSWDEFLQAFANDGIDW